MQKPGLDNYISSVREAMKDSESEIWLATDYVKMALVHHARVWILGNGGSLAIAQHFAQDLLKMVGVRAQCINDASLITAFTNDDGFENSFSKPLDILIDPRDLIFVFSCSGQSPNYHKIFLKKNNKVAVVGTSGGFMKDAADVCVHIKSNDYMICEAGFGIVADLIINGMKES